MGLQSFEYLHPSDVKGLGLTPERSNYLDTYNFATYDIPQLREEVIAKYDNTITGFIRKFSTVEPLVSEKYIWTELERRPITYNDAILTYASTTMTMTRAGGADIGYRKHEKVRVYTKGGTGVFIVTSITSSAAVVLGTYDEGSADIISAYTDALSGCYVYSLGIEVGKGSLGADFTAGRKLPYSIHSNRPVITRDVYTEFGSTPPQIKWAKINGQPRWFLAEIDATRENFLEAVEKKLMEGEFPHTGTAAATAGLQGTKGVFAQIGERGATWTDLLSSIDDLESLIRHLDKVNGAGINLFLCNRYQSFAFDTLGRTFNSTYGASGTLANHIGTYSNQEADKILRLGDYGFHYGGYTFLKQDWKYLNENTFRGNAAVKGADLINFLLVPVGMTPVSEGDQTLAHNPTTTLRNYMTKFALRDYDTWTEGGAWVSPRTSGDDSFKVHFLEESLIAVFNAEKFVMGIGVDDAGDNGNGNGNGDAGDNGNGNGNGDEGGGDN